MAVAHSGCRPWASSWRNGHQETPQLKALKVSAAAASAAAGRRPVTLAPARASMAVRARDVEQVLHRIEQVLEERPLGPFDLVDLILGALDAHLHLRGDNQLVCRPGDLRAKSLELLQD